MKTLAANRTRSVSKGVNRTRSVSEGLQNGGDPARVAQPSPTLRVPSRGFTLIEIMIVIAIIVILAGIVLAIGAGVQNSARDRSTKATLATLDGAMQLFLKDHPEPASTNWLQALQAFPDSAKVLSNANVVVNGIVPDAWGNPIQYVPSSMTNGKKVGFFQSAGPDGIMGTSDDKYSNGTGSQ